MTVEDVSEMDEDFYGRIEALYDPDRVLIEWNGMWPQDQLQLPDTWELFQQITIIDGSTFDLYLNSATDYAENEDVKALIASCEETKATLVPADVNKISSSAASPVL